MQIRKNIETKTFAKQGQCGPRKGRKARERCGSQGAIEGVPQESLEKRSSYMKGSSREKEGALQRKSTNFH